MSHLYDNNHNFGHFNYAESSYTKTIYYKNLVINALNIDFLPRRTFLLVLKKHTLCRSKEIAPLHYPWIPS